MKELLIEAIKDWGYKVDVVDDNTLSISNGSWVDDAIFVTFE